MLVLQLRDNRCDRLLHHLPHVLLCPHAWAIVDRCPAQHLAANNARAVLVQGSRCARRVLAKGAIVLTLHVQRGQGVPVVRVDPVVLVELLISALPVVACQWVQGLARALLVVPGCFLLFLRKCRRRRSRESLSIQGSQRSGSVRRRTSVKLRVSASFTRRGNARELVAAALWLLLRRPNHAHHATSP